MPLRLLPVLVLLGVTRLATAAPDPDVLASPSGQIDVTVRLDTGGVPEVEVRYRAVVVARVTLGLGVREAEGLGGPFRVVGTERASRDETYAIPVGKASSARDYHNELRVSLEATAAPHHRLDVVVRVFDDGVGFRYEIPAQPGLAAFTLTDERTRLSFPGDPTARVLPLPSTTTSYEGYYDTRPVSALAPGQLLALPVLLERPATDAGPVWMAVTEADLVDYAGLYLTASADAPGTLEARLSPLPGRTDGALVVGTAPHASPWRVLMIADDPGRLIESDLVFNLSTPSRIADPSWIHPGRTTFPWWNGYVMDDAGTHGGVDTATMERYIDFCAETGIEYHSLDGLDIAWYGGPIAPDGPTDVTTAAPSIDMPELLRYARERGVRLRLWVHWQALRPQLDDAFRTYEAWGIEGVMVDFMDRDDQEMVAFYHEMAERAAVHHLTLTLHGSYKPTGMERTWPNVLTSEGVKNQEYNKWDGDNRGTPPAHNLTVPFTRMLAGPMDYHLGGMRNALPEHFRFQNDAPFVQGTRGHQLAMYVVYQNALPMLADYPDAYRGQPGLDFLTTVPVTWDETRVLVAEVGQTLVVARRSGSVWYLGGMRAGEARTYALPLGFLSDGPYEATVTLDAPERGPRALDVRTRMVSATDTLRVPMGADGGFVARLQRVP